MTDRIYRRLDDPGYNQLADEVERLREQRDDAVRREGVANSLVGYHREKLAQAKAALEQIEFMADDALALLEPADMKETCRCSGANYHLPSCGGAEGMTMYPISCCPRGHTSPTDLALVNRGKIQKCIFCGAEMTPVTSSLTHVDEPADTEEKRCQAQVEGERCLRGADHEGSHDYEFRMDR